MDDVNKNIQALIGGDQNVKCLQHIGGTYYVSVNSGYRCVNIRKWFQPLDLKGEIKPTKTGVALRLNEWTDLCTLVNVINSSYSSLGSAQPCYYGDDHLNQLGWLNCAECHPFLLDLNQVTTE